MKVFKSLLLLVSLMFFRSLTRAETSTPTIDVFGGYSHTSNFGIGQNGWKLSGAYNFNR